MDIDEFGDKVEAALAATTRRQLRELTRDLPPLPPRRTIGRRVAALVAIGVAAILGLGLLAMAAPLNIHPALLWVAPFVVLKLAKFRRHQPDAGSVSRL